MNATTITATTLSWKDSKRYWWLLSPAIPVLTLIMLGLYQTTEMGIFAWASWLVFYGLIPALDWLMGSDRVVAPESAVSSLDADRYYRTIVYLFIPFQFAVIIWAAWIVATIGMPWWHLLGLILSVGTISGVGINTAHELGHKTNTAERWLAKLTLGPVCYGHFFVEHNKGHHVRVSTPEDPASSKMGEGFYAFLPRTMIGSFKSGWNIEKKRLQRNGESVWSVHNEVLQPYAVTLVLFGGLTAWLGWIVLPFLLLQAFYGASLLEVVNYMEHYGLLRKKLPDGRVERCRPEHSWNSNNVITNLVLYQLQRHSDHHANPTRRFQALRPFEHSPELPVGYMGMILVSYVPPLFFRIMDHRVAEHYHYDLTQANLYAPRKARLMARWHHPQAAAQGTAETEAVAVPRDAAPATRYECPNCGYIYDEAEGCEHEGIAPGTTWTQLPATWPCPDCAVREKPDFRPVID
ncbi:MAG: alkane 1-monooxygenase [Nevskiaceae bacterium]|nr:MAG: alkane 1-monooxygenase [Nevskiaceae bacterium]TBR71618.1 MAG: alkane 1-monooxygenase [Nevskiaceae bacterium]